MARRLRIGILAATFAAGLLAAPAAAGAASRGVSLAPDRPPIVSSPVYLQDGNSHGSAGLTADFTFDPDGVADVAGYLWGWSDPPTTFAAAPSLGAPLTLALTPPPPDPNNPAMFGQLTLYVRSVDQAGSPGPRRDYSFLIGSASSPRAAWNLADPVGALSFADSSGNGHDATATAVTTGAPGRLISGPDQTAPTVASFNGRTSGAMTAGAVVDTGTSFTVSTWVRADAVSNGWRTVVSARGAQASAFTLRRDPTNRWTFTAVRDDSATDPVSVDVSSTSASRAGVWTHLAGVYDRGAQQISLYVDGIREGAVPVSGVFTATGPVELGSAPAAGNASWLGAIGEVRIWNRVLVAAEIAPMVTAQVGWWSLDGHGFDDSGWGRNLTPVAVSWTTDRAGNPGSAAGLDGVASGLSTAVPAVLSNQSYTVSLWARVTAPTGLADLVAQRGVRSSAVNMQRVSSGRWALTGAAADRRNPSTVRATSTTASGANVWTHLVGVYDAQKRQLRIYVNSVLERTVSYTANWNAAGSVLIGYGWHNGRAVNRWAGAIDDVRIFVGAMTASEIARRYQTF